MHCSTDHVKVHPSLIRAAVQTTASQQACFTASLLVKVCCSHKGTMTSKSALQHRSWQNASFTDQSCCADNSLTAGMFHCKFTFEVCCSHKGTMTSKSALQHRSCQSASLTNQSCCADNRLTTGVFDCKFTCESLLLTQKHYDQQQWTAAQILPNCIPH